MSTKGEYVKPAPIGSKVVTTDDVIDQGYDFSYLKMGGMLKVQKATVDGDLTTKGDTAYTPPAALAITLQPVTPVSVVSGNLLQLKVTAVGGVKPYAYVWKKGTAIVAGQNSDTFSKNAVEADAGSYTVEITDALGAKVTSSASVVTVTPAP